MNEMYKYLKKHSYISENKKSNSQFELSEERAECIANKYDSLLKKQKETIDKAIEYIKNNLIVSSILDGKKYYSLNDYGFDYKKLLEILEDKEV